MDHIAVLCIIAQAFFSPPPWYHIPISRARVKGTGEINGCFFPDLVQLSYYFHILYWCDCGCHPSWYISSYLLLQCWLWHFSKVFNSGHSVYRDLQHYSCMLEENHFDFFFNQKFHLLVTSCACDKFKDVWLKFVSVLILCSYNLLFFLHAPF